MRTQNLTSIMHFRILEYILVFRLSLVFSFCRNKLDGNDYAIKRITLDPKDEQFSRKVTREAKLFSKLNHPNVVRYYSAWIEQASTARREIESESNGNEISAQFKRCSELSVDEVQEEEIKGMHWLFTYIVR